MRSLVVAAEKTADRIFLFISSDAAMSIEITDNVTRRAIPWLFFRNFIIMNFILMVMLKVTSETAKQKVQV